SPLTQPSPSTVEASPLQTPGPSDTNGFAQATGRRPEGRMRASIACARCRRSKTKCENGGSGTVCKSCAINKRPCEYKDAPATPTSGGTYQGRESTTGEVDVQPKKRKRTTAPSSGVVHGLTDGLRTHEDLLDSPWLVPKVWIELFDIYEKHFASDLPFLHRRRFLSPLQQDAAGDTTSPRNGSESLPRPPHDAPLLLAFLALTARYHGELLPRFGGSKPIATAQIFADATRKRLSGVDSKPSLEKAQTYLFLAYHQFTAMQGDDSWLEIGNAIRITQVLGYQHDESRKDFDVVDKNDDFAQEEAFIDQEIQRRTVWSCFILDRLASCGKHRPQGLNVEDLNEIQLPCSDMAFSRGTQVRTRRLGETDKKYAERRELVRIRHLEQADGPRDNARGSRGNDETEWEVGAAEGELSLYVQAVNHFGNVMRWSNKSRRQEALPPYENGSKFKELEEDGQRLKGALPRNLTLTPRNTSHHVTYKTGRNYLLIHALHTLCTIALYREYMPFLPFIVKRPQGPLDEPRIDEKKFPLPHPDYWVKQARDCFGDAREFADLLKACRAANALAESPFAGFTCYIVSWCALYCHFFPRMDPDRALDSRLQPSVWNTINDIIVDMEARFIIPNQWLDLLVRVHRFFKEKRADYVSNGGSPGSTNSDRGGDAGLKDYIGFFESAHKGIGSVT
ncbi:hypothetical protein EK21DRAFT_43906, partial [Setomelanomma holmii]